MNKTFDIATRKFQAIRFLAPDSREMKWKNI